ncbi:MAG TPA: hypothetical protein VL335_00420 [Candidatus Paceibacterota bacterium]|jgi:hypothetical protein|nr:hypothetical protein [Candidatus Paceibacterota bacterium]
MKKTALYLVTLVVLVILLGASMTLVGSHPPVHATTSCQSGETTCLSGWAWSSNVGWISFNSNDSGAGGGPYDVAMDASGNLNGYAWSNNIGWIKFGGLSVFPNGSSATNAQVNTSSGAVSGMARACAGTVGGDCSSMTSRTDGWDGWIELAGSGHLSPDSSGYNGTSTQGITYSNATGKFSGFAWGGDVVGWLQFNPGTNVATQCVGSSCGVTGSSFSFGAGDGNGGYSSNATVTTSPDGFAYVYINWNPVNVSNVKISTGPNNSAGSWGDVGGVEVVNVGTSPNGHSFSSAVPNTDTVKLPGVATGGANVTRYWYLSYLDNNFQSQTTSVTVTVAPAPVVTGNICNAPAHATLCDPADQGIDLGTSNPVGSLTCSSPKVTCQYTCDTGYKLKGGVCVKSSIQEI